MGPGNVNYNGHPTGNLVTNAIGKISDPSSYETNGWTSDVTNTPFPLQFGVPQSKIYTFQVIPAESNLPLLTGANPGNWLQCVAALYPTVNTSPSGFTLPLRQTNVVSTVSPTPSVSTLTYAITYNNVFPTVAFDCERGLSLSFMQSSGGSGGDFTFATTTNAAVATIQFIDYLGVPFTVLQAIPAGATTAPIVVANPGAAVQSITFNVNPFSGSGSNTYICAGNSVNIGLPYTIHGVRNVIQFETRHDGLQIAITSSNYGFKNVIGSTNWRSAILSTSTLASLSTLNATTPARGYISMVPTVSGNACDGNQWASITYNVDSAGSEPQANFQNLNPSAITLASLALNTSGTYAWPKWTTADLVGFQWNNLGPLVGDNPEITKYIKARNQ